MQCCVAIRVSSIGVDAVLNKVPDQPVETKYCTRMKHRLSRGTSETAPRALTADGVGALMSSKLRNSTDWISLLVE